MEIKTMWVGDMPGGAWFFQVRDQRTGTPYNLAGFTTVRAIMVDSDNREFVFPADNSFIRNSAEGRVDVLWPSASLFTKPGRYQLQLEFSGVNAVRRTTVQEILVKELGGVTK